VSLSSNTFSSLLTLWENKLGRFYHKLQEENAPACFASTTLKNCVKHCHELVNILKLLFLGNDGATK
jgi:hypothetical protein